MGFLNPLHILFLALSFTIHCFLIVKSQEPPLFTQPPPPPLPPPPPSPPPPPPPLPPPLDNVTGIPAPSPVSDSIAPLSSPAAPPPRRSPKSEPFPPPPETRRFGGSPEKPKRGGGLNKGETVGLVFAGLIAMLQVLVVVFLVLKRRQLLRQKETQ